MDKEGLRLAEASSRLFTKDMSPEYERVRSMLLGHLAAHGATVKQLAHQEVNDRQNVELLSLFTALLPSATFEDSGWSFLVDDEYKAKVIQSNVVWREEQTEAEEHINADGQKYTTYEWSPRPYFVLGKSGQGKRMSLLLACVGANDLKQKTVVKRRYGELFYFGPNLGSRKRLSRLNDVARSEYPSPEETRALFDLKRHLLVINNHSARVTVVRNRIFEHSQIQRMSDAEIGQFDVNSHLDRIATPLGLQSQLSELRLKHAIDNET